MGWYLDLLSFLLERDVGVIPAVGISLLGILFNMGVVAFARVDNWEHGMDRKDILEAMVWGLLCFVPYILSLLAVIGFFGAIFTAPIWYPIKLYRDQQKREAQSLKFQREQQLREDPAHIKAEAETEQIQQPTQLRHPRQIVRF